MTRLVLASSSPRRVELLRMLVADFDTAASPVEDTGSDLYPDFPLEPLQLPDGFRPPPEAHPTLWAWRKAFDVVLRTAPRDEDLVVVGADTIVLGEGAPLGKPADPEHALRMLRSLRGRLHYVATGYAVLTRHESDATRTVRTRAVVSSVWMRNYTDEELKGYVATGEPLDKAGGYAVQGLGGALVERVGGCYRNVIGLPLCVVREALVEAGIEVLAYPEGGYCSSCPGTISNR
jgi:septum formation protein